ncbi:MULTISPECIES: hypothetical protein [Nonomuraea]|uniref:Uncharacterized protein n=1 Tax=Nonomuraea mangrovi TaxID=2316207 RepID=A0ABW4T9L9_9ACTN
MTDGRVVLFIVVAFAAYIVGRRFQQMLDLWRRWRGTKAALPGMRKDAWRGVRTLLKVGLVAAVLFWAVTHIHHLM